MPEIPGKQSAEPVHVSDVKGQIEPQFVSKGRNGFREGGLAEDFGRDISRKQGHSEEDDKRYDP
ncbi:hypothetical protein MesoLj131b_74050 (plasmid) [Mesorhizobium sp. 131-2-5]|nr:hypothetical protein MesoLj131b_74050 [Mesorhizobium sp. 131-2-5]